MADIFHNFNINELPDIVFEAISTSKGLNNWWTKNEQVAYEKKLEVRIHELTTT